MSVLTDLIYGGSNAVAGLTEGAVNEAIAKYGADKEIAFPDTAYCFPTIYAATGVKVKTLGDLPACVGVLKSLITNQEDLGQALNAGLATAVGAEIIEGLKYVEGGDPYANESGIGFVPDPIIRSLGVPLVTGDIPGVAVVLGKADNAADVVKVVKDYQSKGILTFLVGDVIEQCAISGVKMGLEYRVVPLGHDVTSVIHVVTVAIRAALIFGNVQPGDLAGLLDYTKNRVPAFVNTFGAIDAVVVSAGAGAIALASPWWWISIWVRTRCPALWRASATIMTLSRSLWSCAILRLRPPSCLSPWLLLPPLRAKSSARPTCTTSSTPARIPLRSWL